MKKINVTWVLETNETCTSPPTFTPHQLKTAPGNKSGVQQNLSPLTTITMSYVWTKVTRLATSYNMWRKSSKRSQKLFFHCTDQAIMIALITNRPCTGNVFYRRFRKQLVRTERGNAYGRKVRQSISWADSKWNTAYTESSKEIWGVLKSVLPKIKSEECTTFLRNMTVHCIMCHVFRFGTLQQLSTCLYKSHII